MSLESHLPENVSRRTERQVREAEAQVARYNSVLWFLEQAERALTIPAMPMSAVDPATVMQVAVAIKCVKADRIYAEQLEVSARRIWCEAHNIDPDDTSEQEAGPDPIRDGWIGSDGRP